MNKKLVYHNTKSEFIQNILEEGLTAGSFSDKPIKAFGDIWLAIELSDLPSYNIHEYGKVKAYEPEWVIGEDLQGYPITLSIPAELFYITDSKGKILKRLGE